MMNRGVVRFDMQFLISLLHLPEGHQVIAAREAPDFIGALDLLVEGPTLPSVDEGHITPLVHFQVTVTETDVMVRERALEGKFT